MIILDTNVVSEFLRAAPEPVVLAWLNRQPEESIWTTSITIFEIRMGLELMPAGRRRRGLEAEFSEVLREELNNRVLAFDQAAGNFAGEAAAKRRGVGRPIEIRDAQIAGIALARKATLATRNGRDFDGLSLTLIDPWTV